MEGITSEWVEGITSEWVEGITSEWVEGITDHMQLLRWRIGRTNDHTPFNTFIILLLLH